MPVLQSRISRLAVATVAFSTFPIRYKCNLDLDRKIDRMSFNFHLQYPLLQRQEKAQIIGIPKICVCKLEMNDEKKLNNRSIIKRIKRLVWKNGNAGERIDDLCGVGRARRGVIGQRSRRYRYFGTWRSALFASMKTFQFLDRPINRGCALFKIAPDIADEAQKSISFSRNRAETVISFFFFFYPKKWISNKEICNCLESIRVSLRNKVVRLEKLKSV